LLWPGSGRWRLRLRRPSHSGSHGFTLKTSADNALVVFAGTSRVVDLGVLGKRGNRPGWGPDGREVDGGDDWELRLLFPDVGAFADRREYVREGTIVHLVVGSDEADARRYDVVVGWNRTASSAEAVLQSLRTVVTLV
jgi:hypothetical protein